MIDPVVQAMMDQAKKNTSFEQSTALAFKALSAQAETLRQQIASVTAGSMTDAEKALISATTSDLANSLATLQTDVGANTQTPVEPPAASPPVESPASQPQPVTGTDPSASTGTAPPADPNAPTT